MNGNIPGKLVVVDVPLLIESNLVFMFQEVMVVYVPRHVQLKRLMQRDGLDGEAAQLIGWMRRCRLRRNENSRML